MRKKVSIEEERVGVKDGKGDKKEREKENERKRKETKYYQMIT